MVSQKEKPDTTPETSRAVNALAVWNAMDAQAAEDALLACCGSKRWAATLVERRPYADREALVHAANNLWFLLDEKDWLEAFACHPRIGERAGGVEANAEFAAASHGEQAAAHATLDGVGDALAEGNRTYEDRFGFLYIVFANGRTAPELLDAMEKRLGHDRCTELHEASRQQEKITRLRMDKWLEGL